MPRPWTPAEDALLAKLTPAELSRRTGRSLDVIQDRRVILKRRGVALPDYRFSAERLKAGRSVWTPEADELVRTLRPYQVAMQAGTSPAAARRRRKALGLPPIGNPPAKPMPPRKRETYKPWTKRELQIALSLLGREAVKRLAGRSLSAIATVRCLRKRAGVKVKKVTGTKYGPRKAKQQ